MDNRAPDDDGPIIRAIVDQAITSLLLIGMESRDRAAQLLAHMAILSIEDNEIRREVEQFAIESVWDVDDTHEGGVQ